MRCYLVELRAYRWAGMPHCRARTLDRRVFAETPDAAALLVSRLLNGEGWDFARICVRGVVSGCDEEPPILRREDFEP